jgi:hypothetical protein
MKMMKKFTDEELILYIYKDAAAALTRAIDAAIEEDIALKDRMQVLERTIKQLDKLKLKSPSKKSIKAILDYAQTGKKPHG